MTCFTKHKNQNYTVIGDKKKVTVSSNKGNLRVVGDKCTVCVDFNYGAVEVIGNKCKVMVGNNYGQVTYTGDCGAVTVAATSSAKNVKCIGSDCSLVLKDRSDECKTGSDECKTGSTESNWGMKKEVFMKVANTKTLDLDLVGLDDLLTLVT